ncbi:indolethylamine N-methyltransferase-like isoform X2 [Hyla sarda]|uniref:indolethylamine N-methyltransferase-like isoform X2 n=1 Tax=Hyla sarda TaxID=327740 RepID=UPI0024C247F0|nr:indolethylamine N-methyltransferase-like isoform X2 [Hyla sarda]
MDFTGGEIYESSFDPKAYLASFCSLGSGRDDILTFRLKKCFETFGPGGLTGNVLVDIGTGPSIYHLLSACESFPHIIATDFTESNRQELERWLRREPGTFDWSGIVKTVCDLEGDRDNWVEKENKLRSRIQKVLKCDVTKGNPLDPTVIPPVDCLTTALCLETAGRDIDAYRCSLRNITTLLKPGGHLVLIGVLGDSFYKVGDKTFFCLPLDEETVRNAVIDAGYSIQDMEVYYIPDKTTCAHITDTYANVFIVAQKNLDIP